MKDLEALGYYKALLAPLRFGAGIKGKICDGFYNSTPCVTTPIGGEGMFLRTYNAKKDYKDIDVDARFFKSDGKTIEDNSIDSELTEYYQYKPEGKKMDFGFGGSFLNYTVDDFAKSCERIYNEKDFWEEKASIGYKLLEERLGFLVNEVLIMRVFNDKLSKLGSWRKKNHIQALTWNETLRSTEHLAKYISLKNSGKKKNNE